MRTGWRALSVGGPSEPSTQNIHIAAMTELREPHRVLEDRQGLPLRLSQPFKARVAAQFGERWVAM